MKKIFFVLALVTATLGYGQAGGNRICGSDFSMYGVQGKTYSQALEYAASLHDDYQDYVLNHIRNLSPSFSDTLNLKEMIYVKSNDFFLNKGLVFDSNRFAINFASIDLNSVSFVVNSYSQEANSILS